MKLLIDIDENVFTRLFDNGMEDYAIVNDDLFKITKSIRKSTPIRKGHEVMILPGHATNGDVIKAMFPQIEAETTENGILVDVYYLDSSDKADSTTIYADWWNAPYKGVQSEKDN